MLSALYNGHYLATYFFLPQISSIPIFQHSNVHNEIIITPPWSETKSGLRARILYFEFLNRAIIPVLAISFMPMGFKRFKIAFNFPSSPVTSMV